jgi:hypothetical protein
MAKKKKKPSLVWIVESETTYHFKRVSKKTANEKKLKGYKTKAIAEKELSLNLGYSQTYA